MTVSSEFKSEELKIATTWFDTNGWEQNGSFRPEVLLKVKPKDQAP